MHVAAAIENRREYLTGQKIKNCRNQREVVEVAIVRNEYSSKTSRSVQSKWAKSRASFESQWHLLVICNRWQVQVMWREAVDESS